MPDEEVELRDLDRRVLTEIQAGYPIESRPYAALGERLGVSESEALGSVEGMRAAGVIRRIGAIFDSSRLGYRSTLCAIAAPADRIDEVAELISAYPNVTHNYQRDDRYSVWFTLIATSDDEIRRILDEIAERTGIDDVLDLPALRLFKIRVHFDLTGEKRADAYTPQIQHPGAAEVEAFDPDERALVRMLQDDLPGGETPFASVAAALRGAGVDVDEGWVLGRTLSWHGRGVIRRFGAAVRHHRTGFGANAMGVWDCPDDRVEDVGPIMAFASDGNQKARTQP